MDQGLEHARFEIVESLDRDMEMLVYSAHHGPGDTRAVLAGGNAGQKAELIAALIASVADASGVSVEEIGMEAVEEAGEIEIGDHTDL